MISYTGFGKERITKLKHGAVYNPGHTKALRSAEKNK